MQVREAIEPDFTRVVELYRQLQPADPVLTNGADRRVFEQILRAPWLHLFVLEDLGRVQSTCYLNIVPNMTRAARPYGIIENVVTDSAMREKGYGKRVVSFALEFAWSVGCYKVMLQTGSRKESAHAFYRACGFSGDAKHAYIARRA